MCHLQVSLVRGPACCCRRRLPRLSTMLAHKANTRRSSLRPRRRWSLVGLFAPLCASQHSRAAIRADSGGDLPGRASTASERGASQQPSSRFCCSGNLRRISTGSMLCWLLLCNGCLSLLRYLLKYCMSRGKLNTMYRTSVLNVGFAKTDQVNRVLSVQHRSL